VGKRKNPAVETLPHPEGGWGNKVQGNERFSNRADRKADAQEVGRDMARNRRTEHIIKNRDGKIGDRKSYGPDRYPPRG
jgi:hypothetical protein